MPLPLFSPKNTAIIDHLDKLIRWFAPDVVVVARFSCHFWDLNGRLCYATVLQKDQKSDRLTIGICQWRDLREDVNPALRFLFESMDSHTKQIGKIIVDTWEDCERFGVPEIIQMAIDYNRTHPTGKTFAQRWKKSGG